MKYKVGDEVLVKAKIHYIVNQETELPYEVKERNNGKIAPRTIWIREEDIQPEPPMTAEEAWELAMKIEAMRSDALLKIFDMDSVYCILQDFTPMEAKAKIEAREAYKVIEIGDEVSLRSDPDNDDYKFIVTYIDNGENMIGGFSGFDGGVFSERDIRIYRKTGRHFDIEGMIEQIGGTDA